MWNPFRKTKKIEVRKELPSKDRMIELMLLLNQEAFMTQLTWDEKKFILCIFKFDKDIEENYLYAVAFMYDVPIIDPVIKSVLVDDGDVWIEINKIIVSWINKGLTK